MLLFSFFLSIFISTCAPSSANFITEKEDALYDFKIEAEQVDGVQRVRNIIVILCSGKSGSSTLAASFRTMNLETHHHHSLPLNLHNYLLTSTNANILLIDSTRDFIARKISSYFENLIHHLKCSWTDVEVNYSKNPEEYLELLQDYFTENIMDFDSYHSFRNWKQLGYDCLEDETFNFEKKYQLKVINNLYFVNLRFDDIGNWEEIIQSLDIPINLKNFKIVSTNLSKDKPYRVIYKKFLERFRISRENFDKILEQYREILTHFYTSNEIENFLNRWEPYIID